MIMGESEARNRQTVTRFPRERVVRRKEFTELQEKVAIIETVVSDISDIRAMMVKVVKYAKWAGPSIISAAVAAGVVNGKIGAFLNAIFTGVAQ